MSCRCGTCRAAINRSRFSHSVDCVVKYEKGEPESPQAAENLVKRTELLGHR